MKKNLSSLLLLALACICFSACFVQRSVSVDKAANNPDYTVSYLSQHLDSGLSLFIYTYPPSFFYSPTQGTLTPNPKDPPRKQTVIYRQWNDSVFTKKAER